jgi:predicted GIY-YIG superfamily endonuclease
MMSEPQYNCDLCDSSFWNRENYENHKGTIKHHTNKKAQEFLSETNAEKAPFHVYAIEITPNGLNQTFIYVGMSGDYHQRLAQHDGMNIEKRFPSPSAEKTVYRTYSVDSVLYIEPCNSEERALIREREVSLEMAQKHETVNIVGGY